MSAKDRSSQPVLNGRTLDMRCEPRIVRGLTWAHVALLAVAAFAGTSTMACAAPTEPAVSCPVAGTYTMTAEPETMSAGCSDLSSDVGPMTVTLTQRRPGKTGPDFSLELQGATGACAANFVDACKVQAKCDVQVLDATDPRNDVGTLQFSWNFDSEGFSGINSGSIPVAESLPKGCSFTSKAIGVRR